MQYNNLFGRLFITASLMFCLGSVQSQEAKVETKDIQEMNPEYSPYVGRDFPQRVFFGGTHHHSSYSFDSGMFGNALSPTESFRFARGEEVTTSNGIKEKLVRPLDFLVVSDHIAYLGFTDLIKSSDSRLMATRGGRETVEGYKAGGEKAWLFVVSMMKDFDIGKQRFEDAKLNRTIWGRVVDIASEYNAPGAFTAFNGYEWTSAPTGNNLHRVIIFRDSQDRVKQIVPFSAFDSVEPEHLWEPLMEVTQAKGDSEAHPFLSTEDEFADFETWDFGNAGSPTTPKENNMLQFEYARSALGQGLKHEQKLGVNPFMFGMVGGTDTHASLSTTREEENYFGKLPNLLPGPKRTEEAIVMKADKTPSVSSWQTSAAGLTCVWAQENTRESLFDAMARKEVYATTGTRISVRVFAGWDFKPDERIVVLFANLEHLASLSFIRPHFESLPRSPKPSRLEMARDV